MRGAIVVIVAVFGLALAQFLGGAAVAPLGEEVKTHGSIDQGGINGTSTIETTYDVVFKWGPLVFLAGWGLWAVAWYLREEAYRGFR